MLVAEMRHIFPTTIGLPMELSFYKAAVAAASVECKQGSGLSINCYILEVIPNIHIVCLHRSKYSVTTSAKGFPSFPASEI